MTKKKICFLDRDGTLLFEPPETQQINGLEQMVFLPNVISSLKTLTQNGWELVMVTNQDGLGTPSNPQENYDTINTKLFEILASENISFSAVFQDESTAQNPSKSRKPNTGMVDEFLRTNDIDYTKSCMIGDRESDVLFAQNIGVKGFLLDQNTTWKTITDQLIHQPRTATIQRTTKETDIVINLTLDGTGKTNINTGLSFFDHMLEQIGKHANFDLSIVCKGDLEIDEHHTIEDTALALGQALKQALGDKRGIERYASEKIIVMDESKAEVALDISGRPYLVFDAQFTREYVGDFPTEMLQHFFYSFVQESRITLNMCLTGENTHHLVEVSFKGLARTLKEAVKRTSNTIPSTKGSL